MDRNARRDEAILAAVGSAAERFLRVASWREAVGDVLSGIGEATGVSRVHICENRPADDGEIYQTIVHEWTAAGIEPMFGNAMESDFPMRKGGFGRWLDVMGSGEVLQGLREDAPESERWVHDAESVRAFLCVPIFVDDDWWGWVSLDDCVHERVWGSTELDALRTAAGLIGGAIQRERALHRSLEAELSLRAFLGNIPAIVYQEDTSEVAYGHLTFVSPQVEDILGYTPEEWLTSDPYLWSQIIDPRDAERTFAEAERATLAEERFTAEYRLRRRDGRTIWIHDDSIPVFDEQGTAVWWQGFMYDITERKSAEEHLHEAQTRFRTLVEQLPAIVYIDPLDTLLGTPIYISPQTEALLGYTVKDWFATPDLLLSRVHPDDAGRLISAAERSTRTGERFSVEYRVSTRGGDVLWVLDEAEQALDDRGQPVYWQGIISDITERKEAEERLHSAEEKYRALVEQLPAITYVQDLEGPIQYISPQTMEVLGVSADDWIADPGMWEKLLHPDDVQRTVALSALRLEERQPYAAEYRLIRPDGRMVWIRDEAVVVTNAGGEPVQWQGIMLDVTERKEAEDLERALGVERQTSQRLRELDDMKNTFLTAVSHDLRTPLAAILGLALTLDRDDLVLSPTETKDLIGRIAANARRLNALVADLLDLDRLSRGIIEPNRYPTDIAALVMKVVEGTDALGDHPVTVDARSLVLSVDAAKVERIVENLVSNAARHTPSGTRVWVRVEEGEGGALIVVEDAGPGVPEDLREAVFEPFRQGPGGTDAFAPGVGVGLALVARFAELHGGRAWVEPRHNGEGSAFHVFVPGEKVSLDL